MTQLALLGGAPCVPPELRRFKHPRLLSTWDYNRLQQINVVRYDGGGVVDELEQSFAAWHGRRHALSSNSGTSALFSMYYAVGLTEGNDVIVPGYTFFATASPLARLGCRLVLADCLENGNIDPDSVRKRLTARTRAIVVTHMWGVPCEMTELCDIANKHGLPLLEDASHAHGARYAGQLVGTFGLAAAWSLGAKKLITGGQGGILGTDDADVHQRAVLVSHYNDRGARDVTLPHLRDYAVTGTGLNLRIHPFAAALVVDQLKEFEVIRAERAETRETLARALEGVPGLCRPRVPSGTSLADYAFMLLHDPVQMGISRDRFLQAVNAEGAEEVDAPGTTRPLTDFALFRELAGSDALPVAEKYQRTAVKLPTWYGPDRQAYAEAYAAAIMKVVRGSRALAAAPTREASP